MTNGKASSSRPVSRSRSPLPKQRGVAVIVALVVLAISASLATSMLWDRNLDLRRTANILHLDQAREYALGAEAWSEQILARDAQHSRTDALGEQWATQLPALPVEGGAITGRIEDMQGRFNLNNLAAAAAGTGTAPRTGAQPALQQFRRLLVLLQINPDIASAVADWVDADSTPQLSGGAEDPYYAALDVPYLAANQPMASVSELLLVKGVTYTDYRRLLPYVTALPVTGGATPININTAPWPVIASLADGISAAEAQSIVASRGPNGFQSLPPALATVRGAAAAAQFSSQFFRLTANVEIGSSRLTLYSLLERDRTGATYCVRRTFGTL